MTQQVKMPEPVAKVMDGYSIFWAGSGPIFPLVDRNKVKVGSLLITTAQAEAYAAAKVREALEWQPIDTAPKDGTEILLSNGAEVEQGYWMHIEGGITEHRDLDGRYIGQDEDEGYIGWWDFSGGMQPEPTHWMPRPPPPQHDN